MYALSELMERSRNKRLAGENRKNMEVDVGAYIADLLYEHETVNLPGLGSFSGQYQAANIDHVQGKVHPPSMEMDFNANLVLDDGVLVQYVQKKHELRVEDAHRIVEDFVDEVRQALVKKEIVVFPKLGRLFRDYEGSLKFMAEGTNFNKDAYGLPPVQFFPINRIQESQGPGSSTPPDIRKSERKNKSAAWFKNLETWFDRNILYFIIATVVFIVFTTYWFFLRQPPGGQPIVLEPSAAEVPDERVNVSPTDEESTFRTDDQNTTLSLNPTDPATQKEEPALDTEEPTTIPGTKEGKIQIGVFGNPDNVRSLSQKLTVAGFIPYTEKAGNVTKVGVLIPYASNAELQKGLRDVRSQFEPKAKIVER